MCGFNDLEATAPDFAAAEPPVAMTEDYDQSFDPFFTPEFRASEDAGVVFSPSEQLRDLVPSIEDTERELVVQIKRVEELEQNNEAQARTIRELENELQHLKDDEVALSGRELTEKLEDIEYELDSTLSTLRDLESNADFSGAVNDLRYTDLEDVLDEIRRLEDTASDFTSAVEDARYGVDAAIGRVRDLVNDL